ncbi:MAG: ABC transporter permease [Thermoleophilia bacterium]|nr:ABC transporter permease [Thermoleophilia bacterium]
MRAFTAGFRLQLRTIGAYPDAVIPFFTAPMFAIIFLLIFDHAGREDLTAYALVAPVFIALWWLALFQAGWVISIDRWNEVLELLVAAPGGFAQAVLGRIVAVTAAGVVSFVEVWLVARLLFSASVEIHHPWLFGATVVATLAAMAGTAVVLSGLFVLTRNAATFGNSASFPFYVLGGILVPVSFLPDWIQPLSRVVFLSWSADLLRGSLLPGPVDDAWLRLAMVVLLGAAGFAGGHLLLSYVLQRVRATGDVARL